MDRLTHCCQEIEGYLPGIFRAAKWYGNINAHPWFILGAVKWVRKKGRWGTGGYKSIRDNKIWGEYGMMECVGVCQIWKKKWETETNQSRDSDSCNPSVELVYTGKYNWLLGMSLRHLDGCNQMLLFDVNQCYSCLVYISACVRQIHHTSSIYT